MRSLPNAQIEREIAGRTLCDVLEDNADRHPEAPAVSWLASGTWHALVEPDLPVAVKLDTAKHAQPTDNRLAYGARWAMEGSKDRRPAMCRSRPIWAREQPHTARLSSVLVVKAELLTLRLGSGRFACWEVGYLASFRLLSI
jgi:hypothetical protein